MKTLIYWDLRAGTGWQAEGIETSVTEDREWCGGGKGDLRLEDDAPVYRGLIRPPTTPHMFLNACSKQFARQAQTLDGLGPFTRQVVKRIIWARAHVFNKKSNDREWGPFCEMRDCDMGRPAHSTQIWGSRPPTNLPNDVFQKMKDRFDVSNFSWNKDRGLAHILHQQTGPAHLIFGPSSERFRTDKCYYLYLALHKQMSLGTLGIRHIHMVNQDSSWALTVNQSRRHPAKKHM